MNYPEGRKPPFVLQYQHKGHTYNIKIMADSWEDAVHRIRSIGANGEIIGSNAETIRANPLTLPFVTAWVALLCWWRNWRNGK